MLSLRLCNGRVPVVHDGASEAVIAVWKLLPLRWLPPESVS